MKKFLFFLVGIVAVICVGVTIFNLTNSDEKIKIETTSISINVGETISLDDLGFSHTGKKDSTIINFNAGGDATTSILKYNSAIEKYITTGIGGRTTIVITTNNKKYRRFEIEVEVLDGSKEFPFEISNEEELFSIGTSRYDVTPDDSENNSLYANYILTKDIVLTTSHDPIGKLADGTFEAFNGSFDGGYHTISGLHINGNTYGGLFATIGNKGSVQNLFLKDVLAQANFDYLGSLAGIINGYVDRIDIENVNFLNSNSNTSYTGGLAGVISTSNEAVQNANSSAIAYRININNTNLSNVISGSNYVGGLAGKIESASIEGIKTNVILNMLSPKSAYMGGIAGYFKAENGYGHIRESYSISKLNTNSASGYFGGIAGYVDVGNGTSIDKASTLLGLYFDKEATPLNAFGYQTAKLELNTVAPKTASQLKDINTFVYYFNNSGKIINWQSSVWKLIEGQLPVLKFTTVKLSDKVDQDYSGENNPDSPSSPNTPADPDDPDAPDEPIVDPSIDPDISTTTVAIDSATKLLNTQYKSGYTYLITSDIDLKNTTWTPLNLNNVIFKSDNEQTRRIYNFKIKSDTYAGFFGKLSKATIENISFENATLNLDSGSKYAGIVAGVVNNAKLTNVSVKNSTIDCNLTTNDASRLPEYVGGVFGYIMESSCKISKVKVSCDITGKCLNVGGIAGMSGSNTIIDEVEYSGDLNGAVTIGGLVARNQGTLSSSSVNAVITNSNLNNVDAHIGGVVGINYNTISDVSVDIAISISNKSNNFKYYVGGIAGSNDKNRLIENCNVTGSGIDIKYAGYTYAGGLVGQNRGKIEYSNNYTTSVGHSDYQYVYSGAIASLNLGGIIRICKSTSDVYGEYVGGLVYKNADGGNISECAIVPNEKNNKPCLKGRESAGLVHTMTNGNISNCLAVVKTYGNATTSITASFVINFPAADKVYGEISYCVVSNEFSGEGKKYLETPADILGKKLTSGAIINSVVDTTFANDAIQAKYDRTWLGLKKAKPASGSSIVRADKDEMIAIGTYENFSISSDPNSTWLYNGRDIPTLSKLK